MRSQEDRDRDFAYKCTVCKDSGAVVVPLISSLDHGTMVRPGTCAVKCDMCQLGDLRFAHLRSYSSQAAAMSGQDPVSVLEQYIATHKPNGQL